VVLSEEERGRLNALTTRRRSKQMLAQCAGFVLRCAQRLSNTAVAAEEGLTLLTVGKWRARFARHRLAGLDDASRSGPPRTISDTEVERVITKTLESRSEIATHWSTRSLGKRLGLTHDAVHRIWRTCGLRPHRQEAFHLSADPFLINKVRDIVGLYLSSLSYALVLCVDDRSRC
jgi:transposase